MFSYNEFYNSLLPGNYALTKSMELTRNETSGTLWYMKKFLVLYYFVFLSEKIKTDEYIDEVISIFDNYIMSLSPEIRSDATDYFYSSVATFNLKSEEFKTFRDFAPQNRFANKKEEKTYYKRAKKLYFALLMGSGGQTGVKKILKESAQSINFTYSVENYNEAIFQAAISTCVEQINTQHKVTDNSVKYIISKKTINELTSLSLQRRINEVDVMRISQANDDKPKFNSISNDVVAFIRNERQILYYYGYCHSKSYGHDEGEFSSLTPVGELAITANSTEFFVLWEHQKLKMISQSINSVIKDVVACDNDKEKFATINNKDELQLLINFINTKKLKYNYSLLDKVDDVFKSLLNSSKSELKGIINNSYSIDK